MEDDITEDIYMENPQNKINFIPCLKWVKRGVAKSCPEKVSLFDIRLNYNFKHCFRYNLLKKN